MSEHSTNRGVTTGRLVILFYGFIFILLADAPSSPALAPITYRIPRLRKRTANLASFTFPTALRALSHLSSLLGIRPVLHHAQRSKIFDSA
ncbi:hypothetical protein TWF506_004782 [Arthrobotrys conoides]|uniref:Uncharacterized protein n=1 Tax=Arthrobotrys conoides TaxID=74498 RepID=A0AAN8N080_9PEZI